MQVLSKAEGSHGEADREVQWEASSCYRGREKWYDAGEVLNTVDTGADRGATGSFISYISFKGWPSSQFVLYCPLKELRAVLYHE